MTDTAESLLIAALHLWEWQNSDILATGPGHRLMRAAETGLVLERLRAKSFAKDVALVMVCDANGWVVALGESVATGPTLPAAAEALREKP